MLTTDNIHDKKLQLIAGMALAGRADINYIRNVFGVSHKEAELLYNEAVATRIPLLLMKAEIRAVNNFHKKNGVEDYAIDNVYNRMSEINEASAIGSEGLNDSIKAIKAVKVMEKDTNISEENTPVVNVLNVFGKDELLSAIATSKRLSDKE